jgi:hypothetical protein
MSVSSVAAQTLLLLLPGGARLTAVSQCAAFARRVQRLCRKPPRTAILIKV